jgi:hypothetical protein
MPLIGRFPAAASPVIRADEAAGAERKIRMRGRSLEALDITKHRDCAISVIELDLVCAAAGAIKLKFRIGELKEFL